MAKTEAASSSARRVREMDRVNVGDIVELMSDLVLE
jgi:hypothetical protein